MGIERQGRSGGLTQGVPALMSVALAGVALAWGGPAATAARAEAAATPRAVSPAGVISTVAGGVGGPARATRVALGNRWTVGVTSVCLVSFGGGHLFIADGTSVRKVNPRSDWLTTPAGTGGPGPSGNGGPAARASLGHVCGLTVDAAGNLVIQDSVLERVLVVARGNGTFYGKAMKAGHIYSVAGNGIDGFVGDGGPATSSEFEFLGGPAGLAVAATGNLLIADKGNNRIRLVAVRSGTFYGQVMTAGNIYTIAGSDTQGFSGDGGPATSAGLDHPESVAVDPAGNVLIADSGDNRIRVVAVRSGTFYGQVMKAGHIYTIAGNGQPGFSGDGGPATKAGLRRPAGIAVDAARNVLIADTGHNRVRVVAHRAGTFYGRAMKAGHIYTVAGEGSAGFTGDGGRATSAELNAPEGVAVDGAGNLLIGDVNNERVRAVAVAARSFYGRAMKAGHIYTVAGNGKDGFSGDGGPATSAQFSTPAGLVLDAAGNLLIGDDFGDRVRVVAHRAGTFYGKAMKAGDIYTIAGDGSAGFTGDGGRATRAELNLPEGVAVDRSGNVLISDAGNDRVRVVAVHTGPFYGQAMTAGHIYTIAGDGSAGFTGDGGLATSAELNLPKDVAVDRSGNVLISDAGNDRVRVVAVHTGPFYGQAMTGGDIYTIAGNGTKGFTGDGGPATSAELNFPIGMALDRAGNVLISDNFNDRVRVVAVHTGALYGQAMTAGDIYTIAGGGTTGLGDGGPATGAELKHPEGVALDRAGNVLISDNLNDRVRVVAVHTGTFYGQAMTAGDIYTIAGRGDFGFTGDGGPATSARLGFPEAVVVDPAGNVFIADLENNRVRKVAD
jgi:trimeric autotransporter adhesin